MNRLVVAVALLLACASCQRGGQSQAGRTGPVRGHAGNLENGNLLNLVFGATVIDRDNELSYENSAAQAIDGTDLSTWTSAPGGPLTGVFSLPAPTRLQRVGIAVPATKSPAPATLRVETSPDGTTWSQAATLRVRFESPAPQFSELRGIVARYLRFTFESGDYTKSILSLHANGAEIEAYRQPPIEGCWKINGEAAMFSRSGNRVTGVIGRMAVDGGTDGRVYRLMWLDGPMWGFAAVSVSPDGQRLSGVRWHEEVNPKSNGDGWLGERVPCGARAVVDGNAIVDALVARSAVWRLYGLTFDRQDRLVAENSTAALEVLVRLVRDRPRHRFRLVAREFRAPTEEANRARCAKRLTSLRSVLSARGADLSRIELVTAGTERSELAIDFTSQRVMESGVDLQVVPR